MTRDGEPCTTTALLGDGLCFSHSPTVSDLERKAAWRRGGLATMVPPDAADVPVERHQSRAEVARARDEVFALVKARALSPPVGQTLLTSLRDADLSRDRAAQLELDRRGRRPTQHVLKVEISPSFTAAIQAARSAPALPGMKRVGPAAERPR
jgi:hypothetical protein